MSADGVLIQIISLLLGLGTGLLQTVIGIGGGVFLVPVLPLVFSFYQSVSPRVVIGAALVLTAPVAIWNSLRYVRRGQMKWQRSLTLGLGAMIGAWFGGALTAQVSGLSLVRFFGAVVGVMGLQMFLHSPEKKISIKAPWDAFVGAAAGLISSMTGVSGGVLFTPYLSRLRELAPHQVVPTSVGAFALSLTSGAARYSLESAGVLGNASGAPGWLHFEVIPLFMLGAIAGSKIGTAQHHKVPAKPRAIVLGAILILLSVKTLWGTL